MRRSFDAAVAARLTATRGECCWPECEEQAWLAIELPVCQKHAARVHLAVDNLVPKTAAERRVVRTRATQAERGTVYFMQYGELIKIGFTTDLLSRLYKIRGLGVQGKVLATMPGTRRDEKRLQMRFGEHWEHGEYFRPAAPLMEFMDALRGTTPAGLTTGADECEDGAQ